jgi:NAD(P)-dependent dehydrogenase (short-subunit alcohol dehydrogenase family)
MTDTTTLHRNARPAPLELQGRRLDGKVILVTGASAGIGAAAARRFVAEGARVVVGARRRELLDDLVGELTHDGGEALAVDLDVTDEDAVAAAVDLTVSTYGRLDGALNNAGLIGSGKPVTEIDSAYFRDVLDVNVLGVFHGVKHQVRAMRATGGGSIVNVSSVGGLIGMPDLADYIASKWAVIGLTRSVALEYRATGVRVNALAPGSTKTEMYDAWLPTDEAQAHVSAFSPMNQIALPDDMARAALYLLSDESRWTNGTTLAVDGGQHAS